MHAASSYIFIYIFLLSFLFIYLFLLHKNTVVSFGTCRGWSILIHFTIISNWVFYFKIHLDVFLPISEDRDVIIWPKCEHTCLDQRVSVLTSNPKIDLKVNLNISQELSAGGVWASSIMQESPKPTISVSMNSDSLAPCFEVLSALMSSRCSASPRVRCRLSRDVELRYDHLHLFIFHAYVWHEDRTRAFQKWADAQRVNRVNSSLEYFTPALLRRTHHIYSWCSRGI